MTNIYKSDLVLYFVNYDFMCLFLWAHRCKQCYFHKMMVIYRECLCLPFDFLRGVFSAVLIFLIECFMCECDSVVKYIEMKRPCQYGKDVGPSTKCLINEIEKAKPNPCISLFIGNRLWPGV